MGWRGRYLCKPSKHLFWIDGDKYPLAAGQHFAFFIQDFRHVDMLASVHRDFPPFHGQRLLQRDWLEVFDRHFLRERDDVAQFIHLPHSVIEDGRDNPSMTMAGRSGVALREPEPAEEGLAFLVEREFQAHAFGIIGTTDEAKVLLRL